jgi:hypothetical protein
MSHELFLLALTPTQRADVVTALLAGSHWRRTDNGLLYENPDTGVYANVEGIDDEPPSDDGIVAVINYARPTFFALEVVPQLVAAARAADVLVVDPQDDMVGGTGVPKPAVADELIASWEAGNRATSAVMLRADGTAATMPRDRATAWWRYMREKRGLTDRYGTTHYVPGIRLVRRSGSREVFRLLTWTDWIPLILPETEVVAVLRSKGGTFEIRGLLPFATVSEALDGLLRPVSVSGDLDVRILDPSQAVLVPDLIGAATLEPFGGLDAVTADGFVDAEIDAS